jgi:AraC family transcriptional regulator
LRKRKRPDRSPPADYVERVNRAIDHVVRNLDRPLRLQEVAAAGLFSPFHFHRVFRGVVGETVAAFVKRLRLERALHLLSHGRRRSLTEIAMACGFASSSDFTRSFKQRYGTPPSAFDLDEWRARRREDLVAATRSVERGARLARVPPGRNPDRFRVRLRHLPARTVAYIRVLRPYRGTAVVDATRRLVAWAEARGLADGQWLGYQWEDPEVVPLDACRFDVAVVVDRVVPEGEVGRFAFPAMTVAEVDVRGGADLELRALEWLYGSWLPSSGFVPDDQPCFGAWIGRPYAHGFETFELRVQLPVRRA